MRADQRTPRHHTGHDCRNGWAQDGNNGPGAFFNSLKQKARDSIMDHSKGDKKKNVYCLQVKEIGGGIIIIISSSISMCLANWPRPSWFYTDLGPWCPG